MTTVRWLILLTSSAFAASNSLTIYNNNSPAGDQTNRRLTIGRVFQRGEIASGYFARPVVGGTPAALWQNDQVNRYTDGSLKRATISFIIPTLASGGTSAITFQADSNPCSSGNQAACDSAALTKTTVLSHDCGGGASTCGGEIQVTANAVTKTANWRTMLTACSSISTDPTTRECRYWLKGPVATQVIVEDRSAALAYDFGWDWNGTTMTNTGSSTDESLHPIFVLTAYPDPDGGGSITSFAGMKTEYILENAWIGKRQDQRYSLALKSAVGLGTTEFSVSTFTHHAKSRWRKTHWDGADYAAATSKLHIDHNRDYLIQTKALPYYDTTRTVSSGTISTLLTSFNATDKGDIVANAGSGLGKALWSKDMSGGEEGGLLQSEAVQYLWAMGSGSVTQMDQMEQVIFGTGVTGGGGMAAVVGHVPIHYREDAKCGAALYVDTNDDNTPDSSESCGRILSIDNRPDGRTSDDTGTAWPAVAGTVTAGGWSYDTAHHWDWNYLPYLLTGEWYQLEDAFFWSSFILAEQNPGSTIWYGRKASWGLVTDAQSTRGVAWAFRTFGHTVFIAPDSAPEKTYYNKKLEYNIAAHEGIWNVTDSYYSQTCTTAYDAATENGKWCWGRKTGGADKPNVLYMVGNGDEGIGAPEHVSAIVEGGRRPWQFNFMHVALGHLEELGFPTSKARATIARNAINQILEPTYNPYLADNYSIPTTCDVGISDCNSPGGGVFDFFTTWARVKTGYVTSSDTSFTETGDPTNSYAYVMKAGLSFLIGFADGTKTGTAAYAFVEPKVTYLNDNPKWAMVPRPVPALQPAGTTATQAIISYVAPDNSACTLEVSESPSYTPLIHDINTSLFSGSNSDSRAGNLTSGRSRVFVVGKRTAEVAADGKRYSRALQAATLHYGRRTCGAEVATFTFQTATIPFGSTYGEPIPSDRTTAGTHAWPDVNLNSRTESYIDPQTGTLIAKLSFPKIEHAGGATARAITTVRAGANWTTPDNVKADDASSATYSGSTQDLLYLDMSSLGINNSDQTADAVQLTLKASSATTGEDAKIEACLSINGVTCFGPWIEKDLTTCGAGCTLGDNATAAASSQSLDYIASWLNANQSPPSVQQRKEIGGAAQGGSFVKANAGVVSFEWSSKDSFGFDLVAGSKIDICDDTANPCTAYTSYTVSTLNSAISVTVTDGSLTFTTKRMWRADNHGILLRKKTTSTHTMTIQYAKFDTYQSFRMGFNGGSGSADHCADRLLQGHDSGGSLDGTWHHMCGVLATNGGVYIFTVSPANGEIRFLGLLKVPNASIGGSVVNAEHCLQASFTWDVRDATNAIYCLATVTSTGKRVLVKANFTGFIRDVGAQANGGSTASSWTWTLASSAAIRDEFVALDPDWDITKYPGIGLIGFQNDHVVLNSTRNGQDTYGYAMMYDPVAKVAKSAFHSTRSPGGRWCTLHTVLSSRDAPWLFIQSNYTYYNQGGTGGGAYTATFNTALSAAPFADCATEIAALGQANVTGVTGAKCTTVTMAAEPTSTELDNTLHNTIVGDVTTALTAAGANDLELLRIVAKNGLTWVYERGYSLDNVTRAHSSGGKMRMECSASPFKSYNLGGAGTGATWHNYVTDPLGTNTADPAGIRAAGSTVLGDFVFPGGHVVYAQGYTIDDGINLNAAGGITDADCPTIAGSKLYGVRYAAWPGHVTGTSANCINGSMSFAGMVGLSTGNALESHPSWGYTASPSIFDGRTLNPNSDDENKTTVLVGGSLYKLTGFAWTGVTGTPSRKRQRFVAGCGSHPTLDISSAATGDVILTTAGDNYKHCWSEKAGECRSGSSVGDLYLNCPLANPTPSGWIKTAPGSWDCRSKSLFEGNDPCIYPATAHINSISQYKLRGKNSNRNEGTRALSKLFYWEARTDTLWNVRAIPGGSWIMSPQNLVNGSTYQIMLVKVPPMPAEDSINRTTFIPMDAKLGGVPAGTNNVIARFGYLGDYGGTGVGYCGPRQETCVAVIGTIDEVTPYKWPSEGTGSVESGLTGLACSSGCTISVPGISGRMMYRQIVYRDAGNATLTTSAIEVVAVP